jgi:hypothetical protein
MNIQGQTNLLVEDNDDDGDRNELRLREDH